MNKISALLVIVIGVLAAVILPNFISMEIALFAGFIIIIGGLIYSDRDSVKLEGIIIIRRTKKGRDAIDRIAGVSHTFWRKLAFVGVVLGIIAMVGGSLLLVTQAYGVATGSKESGVKLLLPGPVSSPVNAPGVFVVPWWIWVIGIAIVIIPHEFFHGIMCRIDGVRIKSVGWLLLAVIPGAFVEPDERQLKKQKKMTKLRVYAAGSFANLLTAGLIILVGILFLTPALTPVGVFAATIEDGPAYNASLNGSIIEIEKQKIMTKEDITEVLGIYKPGDVVTVKTMENIYYAPAFQARADFYSPNVMAIVNESKINSYNIKLADGNGRALLGVYPVGQAATFNGNPELFVSLSTLLLWMFVFSLGIGIVNMLPIGPLDGGQLFGTLVSNRKITRIVSAAMIAVLLFNIVGPLFL
jgi:membrane-associated protease RseP (regulator of RpoE activity)